MTPLIPNDIGARVRKILADKEYTPPEIRDQWLTDRIAGLVNEAVRLRDQESEWRVWVDVVAASLGITCPPGRAGSPGVATRKIDALRDEVARLRVHAAGRALDDTEGGSE